MDQEELGKEMSVIKYIAWMCKLFKTIIIKIIQPYYVLYTKELYPESSYFNFNNMHIILTNNYNYAYLILFPDIKKQLIFPIATGFLHKHNF